ncbi:M61 family metallopeptidase [Cecembia calidifontis]|jgi:predicted metalloprotease with PDZ domain|uniref:Putative metalloprotease with PDZ domain n=1 Tax=Cecembia calidifontis TaxID=1187080 RepID=A0A4V2F734_9BACT|nr:M61 family metallopeptidase [Cecembia calidifontis]RZS98429.1 putative metalloprotease with PDZ domain [Cecembia calidifontis]
MHYLISRQSLCSQFIDICIELNCLAGQDIHLQLAAWRPGRYELANYAQKIRNFDVFFGGRPVDWSKKSKDLWHFQANAAGNYQVKYQFYCNQMDAGGSWSDDSQLYLNFSNFAFDVLERQEEGITVEVLLPEDYQVATALEKKGNKIWKAQNYPTLMDSPFLASATMKHFSYQVAPSTFHLWFNGEIHFDTDHLLDVFRKFTEKQIQGFGEFPSENYHFIFQLLPYKHYHGVEHACSTVITFGPAKSLKEKKELDELIGVSSHELYHFWNVCRIRPKELCPYDLSKETYLDSGLVLEGVTTYMGDLFLVKSGYFSLEEYLQILQKQIQKEIDQFGWKNQSILDSSFDLWLDGYKAGIPDKKVNIYNRGALISLCLDLILLKNQSSLSQVMKVMWDRFGKTGLGYSIQDFFCLLKDESGGAQEMGEFIDFLSNKNKDIQPELKKKLDFVGVELSLHYDGESLLHHWGVRCDQDGKILQIHPESEAYFQLMIGDKILNINQKPFAYKAMTLGKELRLKIDRFGRDLIVHLQEEKSGLFFPSATLKERETNPLRAKWIGGQ